MVHKFRKWLGISRWQPSWRGELEDALHKTQSLTHVQMAVVVAKDSDSYSEILFLLTLLGLAMGSTLSFFARGLFVDSIDLLALPLLGFSAGVLVYQFRALYLRKLAPKAVRERVANKAKAFFFDYLGATDSSLFLLYISEVENEAYFVALPQVLKKLGDQEKLIQAALHRLILNYNSEDPIPAIKKALEELSEILSVQKNEVATSALAEVPKALLFMPTDSATAFPTVMLKGTKDIN